MRVKQYAAAEGVRREANLAPTGSSCRCPNGSATTMVRSGTNTRFSSTIAGSKRIARPGLRPRRRSRYDAHARRRARCHISRLCARDPGARTLSRRFAGIVSTEELKAQFRCFQHRLLFLLGRPDLAALAVMVARNPVHSVLFLILAFFNAAACSCCWAPSSWP